MAGELVQYKKPSLVVEAFNQNNKKLIIAGNGEEINSLKEKNIGFISITEGMDTTTPSGELFFHIFGALAQFERSLIQERVNAGLKSARARGRIGGRPRAIDDEKLKIIKEALASGMSKASVCRTFEVKRSTLIDSLKR
jgi:DNA invertase Pin-like site-specific DNA recombinase